MGEAGKNQGDKKSDKKDDGAGTGAIVLKLDMHCVGCLKKVKKFVRGIDGVTEVKPDLGRNMLTVVGKVDPVKIRDQVAEKTKKKVDIISPQPKKDGGDKKKAEDDKKQPKEPQVSTVVYKMKLHCDGCVQKLRKLATKYKGVEEVKVDNQKELVAVKGTMDVKALTPYLTKNLKRDVEVVPPKKDDAAGGDKKGKEGGGGDKKGKEGGGKGVEHYPSSPFPPVGYGHGYDPMQMQMMMQAQAQAQAQAYQAQQYYYHPGYPAPHFQAHAPQMFSDENPNACSVM